MGIHEHTTDEKMGLVASEGGSDRKNLPMPPEGTHPAVLVDIIKAEKVKDKKPDGTEVLRDKVVFIWMVLQPMMDDGRPYLLRQWLPFSLYGQSKLRGVLESWANRALKKDELQGFALTNLMGLGANLRIDEDEESGKRKIGNVTQLGHKIEKDQLPDYHRSMVWTESRKQLDGPNGGQTQAPPPDQPGAGDGFPSDEEAPPWAQG